MKKLYLGVLGLLVSGVAIAQISSFGEIYTQSAFGYQVDELIAPAHNTSPYSINTKNSYGAEGRIAFNNSLASNNPLSLGFGAEYIPFAPQSGVLNLNAGGYLGSGSYQIHDTYTVFATPGITFNKNSLAYLKAGYSNSALSATHLNSTVNGHVFGLGYKQMIDGGVYMYGEMNYTTYSNKNDLSLIGYNTSTIDHGATSNLLMGVGYKF